MVARDSLSIKNFDIPAFDWSKNFQMLFVKQWLECKMTACDRSASCCCLFFVVAVFFFFFLVLNKV